jgi:hypothetical protein
LLFRSYADPAVHKAYASLMESRPDLAKAMNGVILYGLCKCDAGTGLSAVKRLSELPEEWTAAARVNASAFLYQKVGVCLQLHHLIAGLLDVYAVSSFRTGALVGQRG